MEEGASMVDNPEKELEAILYQSRQLAARLGGGSESTNEITRTHLLGLRDAAREIYGELTNPSREIREVYEKTCALYKMAGLSDSK